MPAGRSAAWRRRRGPRRSRAQPRGSACHRTSRPRGPRLVSRPAARARGGAARWLLGRPNADLSGVLLVRGHGGEGRAFCRLQVATRASRPSSLNSWSASGSTRSPSGGSSTFGTIAACVSVATERVHLLVSRTPPSSRLREAQLVGQVLHDVIRVERRALSSRSPSTTPRRMRSTATSSTAWRRGSRVRRPTKPSAPWSSPAVDRSSSRRGRISVGLAPALTRSARQPT